MNDEEKKELFRQTREMMKAVEARVKELATVHRHSPRMSDDAFEWQLHLLLVRYQEYENERLRAIALYKADK